MLEVEAGKAYIEVSAGEEDKEGDGQGGGCVIETHTDTSDHVQAKGEFDPGDITLFDFDDGDFLLPVMVAGGFDAEFWGSDKFSAFTEEAFDRGDGV